MKKNTLLSILLLIVVLASGQDALQGLSYKHMKGMLGKDTVIFDLVITGNEIAGYAVFPGSRQEEDASGKACLEERLKGIMDEYGVASLEAIDTYNQISEYSGILSEAYKGTHRVKANGFTRTFSLVEDYSGSIEFNGYRIDRDKPLFDSTGAPHAHITIDMLLPKNGVQYAYIRETVLDAFFRGKELQDYPNDSILNIFSEGYFKQYIEANIDLYDGGFSFNWEMSGNSSISMNRKGFLTYRVDNYAFTGGAHGMGITRFLVFDTKAQQALSLGDIFAEGYEEELGHILEEEYRLMLFLDENESLVDAGLFEENIFPTGNFRLSGNGLSFFYNPYELAPYAMGSIVIDLHHTKFNHLLKEDAAVKSLGW